MKQAKLYTYWRSSSAYRVRLALGFKGVAYESHYVNLLAGEQHSPEFLAVNPSGYVPCLVVDGVRVVESVAIVELLEETVPNPPLLPRAPFERARVRALVQTINAGIQPLQNLSVLARVSNDPSARTAWLRHFIERGLSTFERLLTQFEAETEERGPFAFGAQFTMADVYLLPQLFAARRNELNIAQWPRIERAEQACAGLAFCRSAHPDAQGDAVR